MSDVKTYTYYLTQNDKNPELMNLVMSHPEMGDYRIGRYHKPTLTVKFDTPIDYVELGKVQEAIGAAETAGVTGKELE